MAAGWLVLAAACISDDGNYDYNAPEEPRITFSEEPYEAMMGEWFTLTPEVTFSDKSRLSFDWSISDPFEMKEHLFEGPQLNFVYGLRAQTYSVQLTVTDNQNGMKYFYDFKIKGNTPFSNGTLLLTAVNGKSQLDFIKPDGSVLRDIYATMNDGAPLPDGPQQLIRIYHQYMMGGLNLGYWIICSDPREGGVLIEPDGLTRVRSLRENFTALPGEELSATHFIPLPDNGTMTGTVNGKVFVGSFEGYYEWEGYNFFSTAIAGDYTLVPGYVKDKTAGFCWGYDAVTKGLRAFMPAARMLFAVSYAGAPNPAWMPDDIGLDLITLQFHAGGGYLIGRDAGNAVWQLGFMTGGSMVMNPTKTAFEHTHLITANTRWLLSNAGVFYFSSGNKVYRYNPLAPGVAEPLVAQLEGEVSMLRFGKDDDQTVLMVGTAGHLYELNITGSSGNDGTLVSTVSGLDGSPVDLFIR